jgi:hypothetical protein
MAYAWAWLLAELPDTDQAVADEARAAATTALRRVAEDLNARRGVRK